MMSNSRPTRLTLAAPISEGNAIMSSRHLLGHHQLAPPIRGAITDYLQEMSLRHRNFVCHGYPHRSSITNVERRRLPRYIEPKVSQSYPV